jgi:hypothetical protein
MLKTISWRLMMTVHLHILEITKVKLLHGSRTIALNPVQGVVGGRTSWFVCDHYTKQFLWDFIPDAEST